MLIKIQLWVMIMGRQILSPPILRRATIKFWWWRRLRRDLRQRPAVIQTSRQFFFSAVNCESNHILNSFVSVRLWLFFFLVRWTFNISYAHRLQFNKYISCGRIKNLYPFENLAYKTYSIERCVTDTIQSIPSALQQKKSRRTLKKALRISFLRWHFIKSILWTFSNKHSRYLANRSR